MQNLKQIRNINFKENMSVQIANQKIKQTTFMLISQTGEKLGFFTKLKRTMELARTREIRSCISI